MTTIRSGGVDAEDAGETREVRRRRAGGASESSRTTMRVFERAVQSSVGVSRAMQWATAYLDTANLGSCETKKLLSVVIPVTVPWSTTSQRPSRDAATNTASYNVTPPAL